jgi:hypothetical protein
VENHRSDTSLTSRYDEFLFASICEEANGMRLSVVSALARMNVDPWEEATRLAAMPSAVAERTLISTLGLTADRSLDPSQAQSIAARLVRLLPQRQQPRQQPPQRQQQRRSVAAASTEAARTEAARIGRQRAFYWMMFLALAMAMSLLSPRQDAKTDAGSSPSTSSETSPMTSDGLTGTLPGSAPKPR